MSGFNLETSGIPDQCASGIPELVYSYTNREVWYTNSGSELGGASYLFTLFSYSYSF